MGLRINQNIAAFNAYRNLTITDGQMSKSLEKLSSGFRINRAADDAAGLAISEGLRAQVGGLKVAVRNAQDGISVAQTAEGSLTEVHAILQRMRDLAVNAANTGTLSTEATAALQAENDALVSELDRISTSTTFNGKALLDGSFNGNFQVGAASTDVITVDLSTASTSAATLAVDALDLAGDPSGAIDALDAAINTISGIRGDLGAVQNRFEHVVNSVNVAVENLSASESRIRDTDMASEMVNYTRAQILSQAGTAMLAQANQSPQTVLQLFR